MKSIFKTMAVILLMAFSFNAFASNERPLVRDVFKPSQNIVFNVLVQVPCTGGGYEHPNGTVGNPKPCAQCYTVVYTIGGGYTYSAGGNCNGLPLLSLRFNVEEINEENDLVIKGAICDYLASDPAFIGVPCP